MLGLRDIEEKRVEAVLKDILEKTRGKIEKVEMENPDYDEEFASIGKKDENNTETD